MNSGGFSASDFCLKLRDVFIRVCGLKAVDMTEFEDIALPLQAVFLHIVKKKGQTLSHLPVGTAEGNAAPAALRKGEVAGIAQVGGIEEGAL